MARTTGGSAARAATATAIAAAIATLALPATAAASPLDLFGFGGRSPAMAGTGVSTTTDFDAVFLNPAGLADTPRMRVTLGAMTGAFALQMNGHDTGTDAPTGVLFAGALPIPLGGVMEGRVGLGLGFHVPTEAINRARQPFPGEPIYALLESRSQVVALTLGIGARITDRWSAGIGTLVLAELAGGIHVDSDASGRFATTSEQRLETNFAPIVGTRYRHSEALSIGLVFRGESRSDYDIVVTNDLIDELPLTIPTLRFKGAAQYTPHTLAGEVGWRPRGDVLLHGQLAYQRWAAYPRPTRTPVMNRPPQPEPGFHDIVVPRAGVEYTRVFGATRLDVRGGYAFAMTPAPEADGPQGLLDNHRHIFTAGLGLAWPDTRAPIHVDAWFQAHALAPRRHEKDESLFEPDDEVPFLIMETEGQIYAGGLTVGVDL